MFHHCCSGIFFDSGRSRSESVSTYSTLFADDILCDLRFDGNELKDMGIENVDVAGDNPNKIIVCHLDNLDRDAVHQCLMNKLASANNSSELEFDFRALKLL